MSTIAIYDSGVGGLSILDSVRQANPGYNYLFVGDNQAFPYGLKGQGELVDRVCAVVKRIVDYYQPGILIVACNTASTVVLPALREMFDTEIIGVVPAIKPAAKASANKKLGLLATPATINRDYTNDLIRDFAQDCAVTKVGSSELVSLAEDKLCGASIDQKAVETILMPFLSGDIDTLVLACTHFPLLKDEIMTVFTNHDRTIRLIDSGEGIARRTAQLLQASEMNRNEVQNNTAAFTALPDNDYFVQYLKQQCFTKIELLIV